MSTTRMNKRAEVLSQDPLYSDSIVPHFIGRMIKGGKKSTAERVFYSAFDQLKELETSKAPLEVFLEAVQNVKPLVEVRSRRLGGSTLQVPVEVPEKRQLSLAIRWIITAARNRSGHGMSYKLAHELFDASHSSGAAYKKREDAYKMAEANRAFAHYRV